MLPPSCLQPPLCAAGPRLACPFVCAGVRAPPTVLLLAPICRQPPVCADAVRLPAAPFADPVLLFNAPVCAAPFLAAAPFCATPPRAAPVLAAPPRAADGLNALCATCCIPLCCCENGIRCAGLGCVCANNCLLPVCGKFRAFTARSDIRVLAALGDTGNWPRTMLAF